MAVDVQISPVVQSVEVTTSAPNVVDVTVTAQQTVVEVTVEQNGTGGVQLGTGTAGANISAGRVVKDLGGTITVYNPNSDNMPCGMTHEAYQTGELVQYYLPGSIVQITGWGLTQGATYWIGSNGQLIASDNNTTKSQIAGVALAADRFLFDPSDQIIF